MKPASTMGGLLGNAGPVTKWLCGITLVLSVGLGISGRYGGLGIDSFIFSVPAIFELELWRIFTFPFVEPQPFSLIFSLIILWLFGNSFEQRWGSREFLKFFLLSSFGAAILAIPLSLAVSLLLPMTDLGVASGPVAAIDAMLVAMALLMPEATVLFGFVLPINVRLLVVLLIAFQLVAGLMGGSANLAVTLGGMTMGWLLITGNWRPRRLGAFLATLQKRRGRGNLRVVPKDDGPTLH